MNLRVELTPAGLRVRMDGVTYRCAGCKRDVPEDDAVWVNPTNGQASWEHGEPYHIECAPRGREEDK